MKENLTEQEANIFYYLIEHFKMNHKACVKWAYSRYEDDGVLDWIEKFALSYSLVDVKEILSENFYIQPLPKELLIGEIAMHFFEKKINANIAVGKLFELLSGLDEWDKEEVSQVYRMDDYYSWHGNPDSVVTPILAPLLKKYENPFKEKFYLFHRYETQ